MIKLYFKNGGNEKITMKYACNHIDKKNKIVHTTYTYEIEKIVTLLESVGFKIKREIWLV